MTGPGPRFDPSELGDGADPLTDHELAGLIESARTLERYARLEQFSPSLGFEDRVMAAVAQEAPPRPVAGGWSPAGFARTLRDSWRILWSGDRPMTVRTQALALVLVAAVAAGSVGGLAAVGAARLLAIDDPLPVEPVQPSPVPTEVAPWPSTPPSPPAPTPAPSLTPSPSPVPSPSPSPSPTETVEPSETPDDDGGSEGGGPSRTRQPSGTDAADEPDEPDETERPDDTPHPDDTPDPDDTPRPTRTPDPDDTPDPTDDDSSGPGSGDDR